MKERHIYPLAAAAGAVLSALGFAPLNLWYLSFLGPALFLYAVLESPRALRYGYLYGLVYSLVLVHWLAFNSGAAVWMVTLSMLAAAAFLALNYLGIAWVIRRIADRSPQQALIAFPFVWVSVEYLRSFGALGFPWAALGNTQSSNLQYIQMADIASVYLVSLFMVSVSTVLYALNRGMMGRRTALLILAALLLLPYAYGGLRMGSGLEDGMRLKARIIQPNYDSHEKWKRSNREKLFADMDSLSRGEGIESVDLIIWPESATPMYIRSNRRYRPILEKLTIETGKILLTGAPDLRLTGGEPEPLNSLIAFEPGKGITSSYDKVHLVPFGEYIPLSEYWPALNNLNLGQANFSHGEKGQTFIIADTLMLAAAVCYESIFPLPIASSVRNGAKAIINVSNDSWFGRSWGPYQHASQAIFRAIETRRPFFRSANTGISAGIDIYGRKLREIPLYDKAYIDVELRSSETQTVFVRFGETLLIIPVIISLCMFAVTFYRRSS